MELKFTPPTTKGEGKRSYSKRTISSRKCIKMSLMAGLAFLNAENGGCSLRELYAFIVENFEGFDIKVEAWKKSIRHSLCTDRVYAKAPGEGNWKFEDKETYMEKLNDYLVKNKNILNFGLKDPKSWAAIYYGTRGLPQLEERIRQERTPRSPVNRKRKSDGDETSVKRIKNESEVDVNNNGWPVKMEYLYPNSTLNIGDSIYYDDISNVPVMYEEIIDVEDAPYTFYASSYGSEQTVPEVYGYDFAGDVSPCQVSPSVYPSQDICYPESFLWQEAYPESSLTASLF